MTSGENTKGPYPTGQWVQVYGQIKDDKPTHPDDVLVEMFSHNEQFSLPIRADRVTPVGPPEGIATRCAALRADDDHAYSYSRCRLHTGHDGDHVGHEGPDAFTWPNNHTDAYVEDK